MKHRALTGMLTGTNASRHSARNAAKAGASVGLLITLGFACVDADIPTVSNRLRAGLEQVYANAGAPPVGAAGNAGSASVPLAGAGGAPDSGEEDPVQDPDDDASGGAAGSSMASAGAGGGGDEGAAGGPPVSGDGCDGFEVLQQYCATSGCHGQPGAALGDFASSEEAAREYIDRESGLSCSGQGSIIDPENPGDSLLVTKMSSDPPCGQQMPPTGLALSDAEVACVEEWIAGL